MSFIMIICLIYCISLCLLCSSRACPVDPVVATGNPSSAVHRSVAAYGSVPGMPVTPGSPAVQTLVAAQQQELLYRELLSRAPYANDPVLTQQVSQT